MNNRTQDFLELLYGHAANYQARGTFHSTEQLSFMGTGRYRGFLHIKDPAPGSPLDASMMTPMTPASLSSSSASSSSPSSLSDGRRMDGQQVEVRDGLGYNGGENDISYCIVSNILVAHMTRWQLIMEDDGAIWLGRGAPQRWFRPHSGGFNVTAAPTKTVGMVDFNVTVVSASEAAYSVAAPQHTGGDDMPRWSLRWPGKLVAGSARCTACTIVAEDPVLGIVSVRAQAQGGAFKVQAKWTPQ